MNNLTFKQLRYFEALAALAPRSSACRPV